MRSADPRLVQARRIVESVKRVYAVASSKGGVGKTTVACILSLLLAREDYRVGLLDLDFTNATTHLVLGVDAEKASIEEGFGVKPLEVEGVLLATPVVFTRGNPLALRGSSAVDAMRELLVAVDWGRLDALILDMPPGAKDELLEVLAIGAKILVVTTQDPLSLSSVRRLLRLLKSEGARSVGVIENMSARRDPLLLSEVSLLGFKHLGTLPYDSSLRDSIGSPSRLLDTELARALAGTLREILIL
ncbi:MAG: P-loop NTPase [Acidilobaceae archaeon]